MGQTLSSPVTDKITDCGGDARFLYSVSEMQGWRITMEDAHTIALDLETDDSAKNAFFAVYDGHGGGTVAKYAGQHVHKRLAQEETYRNKDYETAMKKAFLGTDEDLLADPAHTRDPSGCTAVAALVTSDNKIYVANAGDSRSVLSSQGVSEPLSFDHKPTSAVETARIKSAGGYVEFGRVNGNLALSRALGDFEFKKNYALTPENQVITANPDVLIHEITEEDEFLVLACDGIWDCLSSQDVVNFIRRKVWEGKELSEIGEMMCDHCLAPDTTSGPGIGCDNMTVLIIALLQGRTKEEWYSWIHDRVEKNHGYETPSEPPQIYSQSRIMSFKARREAQAERERQRTNIDGDGFSTGLFGAGSGFGGLARVLGSTGGISFHPGSGIMSDTGALMFGSDDSDDESVEEDMMDGIEPSQSLFGRPVHIGGDHSDDATKNLKEKLAAYENEGDQDDEGADEATPEPATVPPASPSPTSTPPILPNGDAKLLAESSPAGDESKPAAKADGPSLETSEIV